MQYVYMMRMYETQIFTTQHTPCAKKQNAESSQDDCINRFRYQSHRDKTKRLYLQSGILTRHIVWNVMTLTRIESKSSSQTEMNLDCFCFHYFIEALLEALFTWILLDLRSQCSCIFFCNVYAYVCARPLSPTKSPPPLLPTWLLWWLSKRLLVCANRTCVRMSIHVRV